MSVNPKKKRSLGQVFLKVEWPQKRLCERLKDAGVKRVIEIGPGAGALTDYLIQYSFSVTAVEKDDRFYELMSEKSRDNTYCEPGQLSVINEDFLKFDLKNWVDSNQSEKIAVVGNIPYNISSPIVIKCLECLAQLQRIEFLTQLEFAERVAAEVGTKNYGSLSVYSQLRSSVKLNDKVSRGCFTPVPKVDSALVEFTAPMKVLDSQELLKIEKVTRSCFQMRRKMIRNGLKPFLNEDNLENFPVDVKRRPDSITPEEFVEIVRHLSK